VGSFADGIRDGLRSAYCSQVAGSPQWFTNLRRVLVPRPLREGADNLYRWVCNQPTENAPPLPPPPFAGGQCSVGYTVTVVYSDIRNGTPRAFDATRNVVGPILGLGPFSASDGDLSILRPQGNVPLGLVSIPFPCSEFPENFTDCKAVISSIVRNDGLPDDCGDPGPDIPDEPAPINVDIDVTYGPNNEFNITVPVVLAPVFINAKGELNIPVTVKVSPNFNITGNLEIFPGFEFSPSFPRGDDGGPITEPPPQNPTGPGTGDPEEPEEEPEEEPLIIGVLVAAVAQSEPRPSEIDQVSGPSIFAPRLATARFGKLIANQIFWSEDIPVKGLRSYVPCPFQFGADTVVVNAERGVGLSYSPVFSEPSDWPPSLALGTDTLSDNRYPE